MHKSVDYYACCICHFGLDQARVHQLMVKCPTNAIALHIVQLLCYCKKANLCSMLNSGRQISYWLKLIMASPRVQP